MEEEFSDEENAAQRYDEVTIKAKPAKFFSRDINFHEKCFTDPEVFSEFSSQKYEKINQKNHKKKVFISMKKTKKNRFFSNP